MQDILLQEIQELLFPADCTVHLQAIIAACTPCSIPLKPTRTSLHVGEFQMVSSLKGIFPNPINVIFPIMHDNI